MAANTGNTEKSSTYRQPDGLRSSVWGDRYHGMVTEGVRAGCLLRAFDTGVPTIDILLSGGWQPLHLWTSNDNDHYPERLEAFKIEVDKWFSLYFNKNSYKNNTSYSDIETDCHYLIKRIDNGLKFKAHLKKWGENDYQWELDGGGFLYPHEIDPAKAVKVKTDNS